MRHFYPYCGYKLGFCMSDNGCKAKNISLCGLFRRKHPVHKEPPLEIDLKDDMSGYGMIGDGILEWIEEIHACSG